MTIEVKSSALDGTYRSDHQKNTRPGLADTSGTSTIERRHDADKASDMVDDFAHKAKAAGDTLMEKASDVGHSMQETGHNLAEKSKHTHQAICSFTKENPTTAVLIAFGLGTMLARMLPGR